MTAPDDLPSFTEQVGLFPLPNVVLFPGMTLPLQVYEPRYRSMVRDALADQGVLAMALLKPGYEPYYFTNLAEIHRVVCVGRIREYVKVPDGRYFINLFGLCRARVREEDRSGEYRLVMLDPLLRPDSGIEIDGEYAARESLRQALESPVFDASDDIDKVREAICASAPLGTVVDMIAAELLPAEAVEVKQRLLEELNALRRAAIVINEVRCLERILGHRQALCDQWPRLGSMN